MGKRITEGDAESPADTALGGFPFTVDRIVFLLVASVLVFGTIGATWREVDTSGDVALTLSSTLIAVIAQLGAIVGGAVGRPARAWLIAIVLSICAVLSALVAAVVVI